MKKTINITKEQSEYYNSLLSMTGDAIYTKYGLKRDKTIIHTVNFENGLEMGVKLVIRDGENKPYTEAVLFDNGHEISCTGPSEEFTGEWLLKSNNEEYIADVYVEPIETMLSELKDGDIVYGFAFDIATDGGRHDENTIVHKLFCKPLKSVIEQEDSYYEQYFVPFKTDGSKHNQKKTNSKIRHYARTEKDAIFIFNQLIHEKREILLHKANLLSEYLIKE